MSSSLPAYYWDSCVMLSYINGVPDRLSDIEALLSRSGKDFTLVTSVLSIVEVAFAKVEQDAKELLPDQAAAIARLWEPGSPIGTVEVFQLIAEDAQALMREAITKGWSLKAADAIHLATADRLKVAQFHTYDEPLEKYSEITKTKFTICAPTAAQLVMILNAKQQEGQELENSALIRADNSSSTGNAAAEKEDGEAKQEPQPEEPKAAAALPPVEPEKTKPTAEGGLGKGGS